MSTPADTEPTTAVVPRAGIATLLRIPAFRSVFIANVLSAIVFSAGRFVYVWLVGELTEWNPATAILGIVIGLPPLFLSAWAGALADRVPAGRLGTSLFLIAALTLAPVGVLVQLDAMTVPLAMVCGCITIVGPAMLIPLIQALVPSVTPREHLMSAVALQNLGMMASTIGGLFVGGAMMQVFGTAAGFWLLVGFSGLGAWVFARAALPSSPARPSASVTIREGVRIAWRTEPIRSLLALTGAFGMVIATSSLLLPEFARDILGTESLAASGLNVAMGIGMSITSLFIAIRWTPSRPGLVLAITTTLTVGGGIIAIGLSRDYVVTLIACFAWGLSGGIGMTLMRTLLQVNTPSELMGRVMGLWAVAQNGAFPVTAVLLFGLVAVFGVADTMVVVGLITTVLIAFVTLRPTIRTLGP